MIEPIYVVHKDPTGRQAPYHIANVGLDYSGLPGQVEHLWLNDLGDGTFRIACIPFCADGLSYLDVVRLSPAGSDVVALHRRSGRRVLRVLIGRISEAELNGLSESLMSVAERCGIACEWHGDRFIAFDIPEGSHPEELFALLSTDRHATRIQFEWGDNSPFVPPGRGPIIRPAPSAVREIGVHRACVLRAERLVAVATWVGLLSKVLIASWVASAGQARLVPHSAHQPSLSLNVSSPVRNPMSRADETATTTPMVGTSNGGQ